VLLNKEPDRTR